jgi:hypothetical protein
MVLPRLEPDLGPVQPHPLQPPPGGPAAPVVRHEMAQPHASGQAGQSQQQVGLVALQVVHEERGALAEEKTQQREDDGPGQRAQQVQDQEAPRGKLRHAEDDRQQDPEAVGVARHEGDEGTVALDDPQRLAELPGHRGEKGQQGRPLDAPHVEVELVSEEGTGEGRQDDAVDAEITLESEEPGEDQDGLPFQEGPDEENPVTMNLQIFPEKLLHCASGCNRLRFRPRCRALIEGVARAKVSRLRVHQKPQDFESCRRSRAAGGWSHLRKGGRHLRSQSPSLPDANQPAGPKPGRTPGAPLRHLPISGKRGWFP